VEKGGVGESSRGKNHWYAMQKRGMGKTANPPVRDEGADY